MVHVLVVGAVEETELLLAMRRIVGGIDVQQNLAALAELPGHYRSRSKFCRWIRTRSRAVEHFSGLDSIARLSHGDDMTGRSRILLKLTAQLRDMRIHGAADDRCGVSPNLPH